MESSKKDSDIQSFYSETYVQSTTESSNEDVSKLKELLRQESRHHEETGQCYNTLQKEYDELLKRFAEAENTIDKLRIGARIKLYYDKPSPPKYENNIHEEPRCRSAQMIPLAQSQKGVMSRAYSMPEHNFINNGNNATGIGPSDRNSEEGELVSTLQSLQDDIANFQMSLSEGNGTIEEHQHVFGMLREEYEKVHAQLKELDDQHQNSTSMNSTRFTDDLTRPNSLQAEVYRLGLRLEEINDEIAEQIRNKQRSTSSDDDDDDNENEVDERRNNGNEPAQHDRSASSNGKSVENHQAVHSSPESIQLDMCEKHDEKPGYHFQQEKHQEYHRPPVDSFEQKYLSRSLDFPGVDMSTVCSVETEKKVGSWLSSKENYIATSPKRRTRSSTSPARVSGVHHQQLRHRCMDPQVRDRYSGHSKQSTPEGKTTYTMNSTEDSGFLDGGDTRNSKYGNSHQRSMTSPTESKYNRRCYQPNLMRSRAVSVSSHIKPTNGQEYRDRLNSLRNFVDGRRLSNEDRCAKSKTPRSWVRGKTPSDASHPGSSSSISVVSDVLVHNNNNNNSSNYNDKNCSSRKPSKSSQPRKYSPPSVIHNDQRSIQLNPSITKGDRPSLVDGFGVEQSSDNKMLEALQEEMEGVRDLVLDLKSSIHNGSINPSLNSGAFSSPRQHTTAKKKSSMKSGHPKDWSKNVSSSDEHFRNARTPHQPDMVQQQMHMIGKLNETMERLSIKLQDLENRDNRDNRPKSPCDSDVFVEETTPRKVSFRYKREESSNWITPSAPTQTAMLDNLNKKVNSLYKKIEESKRNELRSRNHRAEHSSRILSEQSRLVGDMHEKLSKIETDLPHKRTGSLHGEYSSCIPVYVQTCPRHGDFRTHGHGSFIHYRGEQPNDEKYFKHSSKKSEQAYKNPDYSQNGVHDLTTDGESTSHSRLSTSGPVKLSNVIHHYHNFCQPSSSAKDKEQQRGGGLYYKDTSYNVHPNKSIPMKSSSRDHYRMSTKEIELEPSDDQLYESINSAALAAKKMESLSKQMLSTIATDLFHSKDINEY